MDSVMDNFGARDFILSFVIMTVAIEAFYITIFYFRWKSTGNKRSRRVRNTLLQRNRARWHDDEESIEMNYRRHATAAGSQQLQSSSPVRVQGRPSNSLSTLPNAAPPYELIYEYQDQRRNTTGGALPTTTIPHQASPSRRPTHPPAGSSRRPRHTSLTIEDPSHYNWDQHTIEEGDVKIVPLDPRSGEYRDVAEVFLETLPDCHIGRIERIQNKLLWQKYDDCLKRLRHQYNTHAIQERLLFHGTKANSPSCIYESDCSFDMRYSQQGMWGKGNYFAVKASYSDDYAHVIGETRQMLVAMVITGMAYSSKPQADLRKPPVRPHKVRGIQVHYDSVQGEAKGSKIYITYENDRAYPMYLISYKK